jgi:hypothetical protein
MSYQGCSKKTSVKTVLVNGRLIKITSARAYVVVFIDIPFGAATGSSTGGGTGSQAGAVGIVLGGIGTLEFDGTTTSSSTGNLWTWLTTEVPGTAFTVKKQERWKF